MYIRNKEIPLEKLSVLKSKYAKPTTFAFYYKEKPPYLFTPNIENIINSVSEDELYLNYQNILYDYFHLDFNKRPSKKSKEEIIKFFALFLLSSGLVRYSVIFNKWCFEYLYLKSGTLVTVNGGENNSYWIAYYMAFPYKGTRNLLDAYKDYYNSDDDNGLHIVNAPSMQNYKEYRDKLFRKMNKLSLDDSMEIIRSISEHFI